MGSILSMNGKLAELHRISLEMKHRAEAAYHTKLSPGEWREKLRMDKSQWSPSLKESLEELWAKWDERKELLARRRQVRRLRGAFPNMKHRKHQEQLHEVKAAWEELKERGKKKKASNGKKDEKKC